METETLHCYSCGGSFSREELQYRPIGKGHTVSKPITCPVCNEKQKKKETLTSTVIIPKLITSQTSNSPITAFVLE